MLNQKVQLQDLVDGVSRVIEGEVVSRSPHGTHTVIRLSRRVTICQSIVPTDDDENPDFEYIIYIGVRSQVERDFYVDWALQNGGYFRGGETFPRKSKRVPAFPFELKIRGVEFQRIIKLVQG